MTTSPTTSSDPAAASTVTVLRGLAGAAAGAILGYVAFYFLLKQSLYAMVLPGALVGFCAGAAMQREFKPIGYFCALVALVLGVGLEWRFFPFVADKSLGYFLAHLHQVLPMHLAMIALGAFIAFWFGTGRRRS